MALKWFCNTLDYRKPEVRPLIGRMDLQDGSFTETREEAYQRWLKRIGGYIIGRPHAEEETPSYPAKSVEEMEALNSIGLYEEVVFVIIKKAHEIGRYAPFGLQTLVFSEWDKAVAEWRKLKNPAGEDVYFFECKTNGEPVELGDAVQPGRGYPKWCSCP